jgi:hypothetical protein
MPAKGNDSKQGLIISLVCFVLLALILGVTTYTGYAEAGRQEGLKKTAEDDKKKADSARDWYKFQALLLKTYAGHAEKEDLSDLGALRGQYGEGGSGSLGQGERDRAAVDKMVKQLDDRNNLGWDPTQNKPRETYSDKVARLTQQLGATQQALNSNVALLEKAKKDFQEIQDGLQGQMTRWRAEFDKSQKQNMADKEQKTNAFQEALAQVAALAKIKEDLDKQTEQLKDDTARTETKLKKELDDQQNKIVRIESQLSRTSLIDFDKPKGRIVQLDRTGTTAYINLGSADNVRPQLTFSVSGVGPGGLSNRQRKGSLEVVNVLRDHLSEARVTEVVDPSREPIMQGDLLFNPAWSPGQREHVAIAGVIDLTGEGRDNTAEFIKSLERQGIVVDAYLDLKDLTVKGKGLSLQTNYLILGDQPELAGELALKADDPRATRMTDVRTKIADLTIEARRLGVEVVPFRRFVTLTGYRLPRAVNRQAYVNSPRPAPTKAPAAKEDGEK